MAEASEWEYRVVTFGGALRGPKDEELEAELNALGAEGWEVVGALPRENSNKVTVVAKRPLTSSVRRRRTTPEGTW
jgi:hypothetical protein